VSAVNDVQEFEADFLELLRRSHPFSRVSAKTVYNDFIADKWVPSFIFSTLFSKHLCSCVNGMRCLCASNAWHCCQLEC